MQVSGHLLATVNPRNMCPLKLDNSHGLIFSSSITPISGTVELKHNLGSCEILILDKNSNEILRRTFGSAESNLETSFTWDLKSKSGSFVKSGCYNIELITASDSTETERCSAECRVMDTRNVLSTTRSLRLSHTLVPNTSEALVSIYLDIIQDIQTRIVDRLEGNQFEEPYFVACITERFIQEIADDIQDPSKSRFLGRMAEFQSKNPISEQQPRLGLRALFDFLINYMSDMEDHARANAMARCGQRRLTQNDRAQIISSLVLAIYPHCKTITFPRNAIGSIAEKISEGIIKLGIRFVTTKHINRSISICQTLPLGNPCDAQSIS